MVIIVVLWMGSDWLGEVHLSFLYKKITTKTRKVHVHEDNI